MNRQHLIKFLLEVNSIVFVSFLKYRLASLLSLGAISLVSVTILFRSCSSPDTAKSGMTIEEARRSVAKLSGAWREGGIIYDSPEEWTGSAVVFDSSANRILLLTNSHCLGLGSLSHTFRLGSPDVKKYEIKVRFCDGQVRPAIRVAETPRHGLDLAFVEVDATGLKPGTSYVLAKRRPWSDLDIGDEVMAIGAPLGYEDTSTFGRVTGLRVVNTTLKKIESLLPGNVHVPPEDQYMLIQTDAQFTHGNSGGALYLKQGSDWGLVGVPTFMVGEGGSLRFAFATDEISRSEWKWYDASPRGAVDALKALYPSK